MATGHLLPGYGEENSRLRRVQPLGYPLTNSHLQGMQAGYNLEGSEFERIRAQARQIWLKKDREPTTYQFYHTGRNLQLENATKSRPTSPTRRNNPHPPQVFLTNRLHFIEGYQNADTTLGKPCYKVDASLSPVGQCERRQFRRKYTVERPSTTLINTYKDKFGVRHMLGPEDAQAAEAWLQIADDRDAREKAFNAVQRYREQEAMRAPVNASNTFGRSRTAYPSLKRWMKMAGPQETRALATVLRPPNALIGYEGEMKAHDIERAGRVNWSNQNRGDYLIHPDWPPSLYHHRIPCTLN